MRHELKRIDPLRTANVGALVYGVVMTAFALLFSPFILLTSFLAPSDVGPSGAFLFIFMLVLYPVMGVVMGWISGFLTSAVYNFIIRWTGGLLFELDSVPSTSGGDAG